MCTSLPPQVFLSMSLRAPSVAVEWFLLMPELSSSTTFSTYLDREWTTASALELFKAVNLVFVKEPWPHPLMVNETWYPQDVSLPSWGNWDQGNGQNCRTRHSALSTEDAGGSFGVLHIDLVLRPSASQLSLIILLMATNTTHQHQMKSFQASLDKLI